MPRDCQGRRNSNSLVAHICSGDQIPPEPCKLFHTSFALFYAAANIKNKISIRDALTIKLLVPYFKGVRVLPANIEFSEFEDL